MGNVGFMVDTRKDGFVFIPVEAVGRNARV